MKKIALLFLILLCVVGLTGAVYADPPAHAGGRGLDHKQKNVGKSGKGGKHETAVREKEHDFNTSELIFATITALAARELAQQGGWTGYKALPPGIAENLARGKALPPGIAKKAIPGGMLKQLPSYPGYTWYSAGKDLVLISAASMVIADVLHDVFD